MAADKSRFKMLVIGDSILWGQGLYDHEKIHTQVVTALAERGLIVDCVFLAHSGAIIGEPDTPSPLPPLEGPFANEVPVGEPTLFEQVETALGTAERDETVQLVLLSGGVNDVDTTRIINPVNVNLDAQIEDAFYRQTKLLLERVYHDFPNAIIMVLGYYLVFSDTSEEVFIHNALKAMGFNVPMMPEAVGDLVVNVLGSILTDPLIERCTRFRDQSHACIRRAIVDLVGLMPEAQERLYFVDPKFKPENAVGAPESFLFGVNADLSPQDPPEIAEGRRLACERYAERLSPIRQFAAPRASVAHPNPPGAAQYADMVLANLRHAMPVLFGE